MSKSTMNVVARTMTAARGLGLGKGELAELNSHAKSYQRWLGRLEASHAAGGAANARRIHDARHIASEITEKFPARLCSLIRVLDPASEDHWSLDLLKSRANEVHPSCQISENIDLFFEPKFGGGYRPLMSFGWKRRTAQRICSDVLKHLYPIQPFDFCVTGRGPARALQYLQQLIEKEKYQYVVTLDIKDCFGSPNKEQVKKLLRLPSWVVNHSLLIGNEVTIKPHLAAKEKSTISIADYVKANGAARRGLPQGSSASSLVMYRAVLGPLLGTLSFADRLVMYCDDIVVLAKDLKTAEAYLMTLQSTLSTSPVGPLAIGRHKISSLNQGANFIGFRIIRKPEIFGGHIHLHPEARSYARLAERARAIYLEGGQDDVAMKAVRAYVSRWISAFRPWLPNEKSMHYIELSLAAQGVPYQANSPETST